MENNTEGFMQELKAKNMASDKKCVDCIYYVAQYKDDFTLRHYGYGKVTIRPACSYAQTYGHVSHNPARLCNYYKKGTI